MYFVFLLDQAAFSFVSSVVFLSDLVLFNAKWAIFQLYRGEKKQATFWWDDDDVEVHFVLEQHAELNFYSASSLKQ